MRKPRLSLLLAFGAGVIVLPLGFALLAVTGLLSSDSVSQAPVWETAIGERALEASLTARAKGLRNPIGASDNAALLAGMKLFRENCAGCHGSADADSKWGANNFYPRVPQFWRVEADDVPSPEQAFVAVRDGIRYSGMGAWNGMLKEEQMWQVVNFVNHMRHLPTDVDMAWKAK